MNATILMFIWFVLFLIFLIFLIFYYFLDIQKNIKPNKNIFIYRFNLFERSYFLEQFKHTQKNYLKDFNFFKENKISNITNNFNDTNSKKFSEILNNLDNGSEIEQINFKDKDIYSSTKNANYIFSFYKIHKSSDYFLIFNFHCINNINKNHLNKNIQKFNTKDIINNKKKFKCFIAFKINENVENVVNNFLNKLNIFVNTKNMSYIQHNEALILVIFSNKYKKIKKRIKKIQNIAENKSLYKTLNNLYKGSAILISQQTNSFKHLNAAFQFLSFLLVNSIKNKINFITKDDIDLNSFPTYQKSLKILDDSIKNKSLNVKSIPILNIKNNNKITAHHLEPNIKEMGPLVSQILMNNFKIKKDLFNTFAEIILTKRFSNPIVIHVYDEWLNENMNTIQNNTTLLIIHFIKMKKISEKIQFIKKMNNMNINFIFFIEKCDYQILHIVQKSKIKYILINDTIWSKNNFLSSDQFVKLITLNKLAIQNKIKVVYKNPSFKLDQEIYDDIGIKYYFKT